MSGPRSYTDRLRGIVDRTPALAVAGVIALLSIPLLVRSWSVVIAPLGVDQQLDPGAFTQSTDTTQPASAQTRLVVPTSALTAVLYHDLDPLPTQTAESAERPAPQAITIQLVAITMNTGSDRAALPTAYVFDTNLQEYTEVRSGDTLPGGAVVRSIDRDGVSLTLGEREIRLELDA